MKLVASMVPPGLIEWRHRIGADGHDEMWEGVLHTNPVPSGKHQDLVIELVTWLRAHWARPNGGRAFNERNVAAPNDWPNDYRVPDIVLLAPERLELDMDSHIEGGPTVAVEIRSPDDESYEKLPFYYRIGVHAQGALLRRDPGLWNRNCARRGRTQTAIRSLCGRFSARLA